MDTKNRRLYTLVVFLLVTGIGLAVSWYLSKTAPKARKSPPTKMAPLVQVIEARPESHQILVPAMGTVIPAHQVVLKTRVSGQIVATHPQFVDGGFIKADEEILKIDLEDYRLALAQKKSAVADAEYALKLEYGRQDVALQEWKLLGRDRSERAASTTDEELALRKPHLAKAKAALEAALAEMAQAELDLSRTSIRIPFNAVIRERYVDLGSQVSIQDALADLAGIDEYWVKATLPVDRLAWISFPRNPSEPGSPARLVYRNGYVRSGRVLKLLGELEPQGRMAQLLIQVKDPFSLDPSNKHLPPILLGEFVKVEIDGPWIPNVFQIPRQALRDNTYIWTVTSDNKLDIRRVEAIWRNIEFVLLQEGLVQGDRLVVSDLAMPIAGMDVQATENIKVEY